MAEIEAQLADEMDVSAAVQLERLEELERAMIELDPDQFVRKIDPRVAARRGTSGHTLAASTACRTTSLEPALPAGSHDATSSEPSLSSF